MKNEFSKLTQASTISETKRDSRYHTNLKVNLGPAGVAAVLAILPPGGFIIVYQFVSALFSVWTPVVEFLPLRLLTREDIQSRKLMKPTQRSTIFRCITNDLQKSKSSMLQDNNLAAACMSKILRKTELKKSAISHWDWSKGESFAHHASCSYFISSWVFLSGTFRFLRSLWERRNLYKCSTTCYVWPTLSACLRCRALVVYTFFATLCRSDCALLCCAWGRCSTTTCPYTLKNDQHQQKFGKKRPFF